MRREFNIQNLINIDDVSILGNDVLIDGLNLCNRNTEFKSILSYVTNEKYVESVKSNKSISALVIPEELVEFYNSNIDIKVTYLVAKQPEMFFYRTHKYLYEKTDFYDKFDFASKIGQSSNIHNSVVINPGVIIGNNVTIGANSVINKGSVIEDGAYIGCNTTIGSEGFQIVDFEDHRENIKHVGGTLIKKNAYIGDNTAICNCLFEGNTIIEENARVDNLVHVAHNCYVGKSAILTAGVILCGSSIIEDDAWVGVNSSVLNNVVIGKKSKLGIGSVATKNVPNNSVAYGVPAKVK
jgi:UDP-3-O-[3-hydroxymyristoyl] glucosamine N-acyltransferase